jgi:RNA polymerase sigma-70 factor, ECF subfamily
VSDDDDFDSFYREIHPRLWAFLVRSTREPALAEELAQESFVRLLASRGATLPRRERQAYVFRIAENLTHAAARRRAREKATPLDAVPQPIAPATAEPVSRRSAAAFAALSVRERELLWLAHVENWKHAEIASILGLAPGSIRVLLHRARQRFLKQLDKETPR